MSLDLVKLNINRRAILAIFLIIPIIFGISLFDYYFRQAALLPYMGLTSLLLPLYLLFFELPHIVSSFIGFIDREYLYFYRRYLFLWLPLFLIVFSFLVWWNLTLAIVLYLVATMYHVMRQQTGIALMFGIPKNNLFQIWSWLAVLITTTIYLTLGAPELVGVEYIKWAYLVTIVTLTLLGVVSIRIAGQAISREARVYVGMTFLMLVASYILLAIGYLFFAIFMIRFIHDITAFIFYITHEINRNQGGVKNYLYKLMPFIPQALWVVVPALGVGIGLTLRQTITSAQAIFIASMFLARVHYYLESIMWKRDSLHRRYIKVE